MNDAQMLETIRIMFFWRLFEANYEEPGILEGLYLGGEAVDDYGVFIPGTAIEHYGSNFSFDENNKTVTASFSPGEGRGDYIKQLTALDMIIIDEQIN